MADPIQTDDTESVLIPTPPQARPSRLPQGFSAFRHRNFRLFWGGMAISLVGTWMQQVGQAWLVLQLTNDPLALGIVGVAQFTPVLFLGLFGGIVADAVSKRKALVVTQTAAGFLALVLGFLVVSGQVQVWHVYVLAVLLGTVNAFDMPIRQSFVVEMVGRDDVANAVALNSAVFNMTRIVGPAIAGLTIAFIGLEPLFFVNAASYLAVVGGLFLMRPADFHLPSARAVVPRNLRSVVSSLVEGLRYVRRDERIFLSIAVLAVVSTFALNFTVLIPVLARDVLHGDADTYGFLMSASGVGSLISALSIAFGQRPTVGRLLAGAAAIGFAMIALAFSRSMLLDLGLMFVAGWGTISMAATCNTIIQLSVPDVLRGRVMSVYTTVFAGTTPFGALFAGSLAAFGGAPLGLWAGGAIALVAAIVGVIRLPGGSRLETLPGMGWRSGSARRPSLGRSGSSTRGRSSR
jgi:MFS family permease